MEHPIRTLLRPPTVPGSLAARGAERAAQQQQTLARHANRDYARDLLRSRSPNTITAYTRQIQMIDQWLGGYLEPLTDRKLAAWCRHLEAEGKAPATVAQAVAAACYRARVNGETDPRGQETAAALEAIRRTRRDRGRGASSGVTLEQLGAMLAAARAPGNWGKGTESPARTTLRARRDSAMLGLLFYAGLRRSEAAALQRKDVAHAQDILGAARITLRHSKTDQAGEHPETRIVKNEPAAALLAIAAEGPPDAPVLGIGSAQITRRMKALAEAAGIQGCITSHSGRIGLASELTRLGASTIEVMRAAGWKTARMAAHYASGAAAERGAVAKYL